MKHSLLLAACCALALQSYASTINYNVSSTGNCDACGWSYNAKVGNQSAGLKFNKDGQITSPTMSYAIKNVAFSYACSGTATTSRGFYFKPYDADGHLVAGYEGMLPFATMTTNYAFTAAQNVRSVVILMTGGGSTGTFLTKTVDFELFQLDAPADLVESNVTYTGFDLSWSAVAGADSYDIEVKNGENVVWQSLNLDATSCSVSGLTAGTEYDVSVVAKADDVYELSEAAELSVTTRALTVLGTPVLSVDPSDVDSSSAVVSWTSVANASGYAVAAILNNVAVESDSLDSSATSWTVAGLQPGTTYTLSVTALGDGVSYADSAAGTTTVTTEEDLSAPDWTVSPVTPAFAAHEAGSFTISATRGTDDFTSDITLSVSPAAVSAPVLSNGSVFWTPAWEDAGKTFTFTFTVNVGGTDYEHLVMIPLEALPQLTLSVSPVSVGINLGETAETVLSAVADDDRAPLALTDVDCGGTDLSANLDTETGAFSWTPSATGEYLVSFNASDAYPLSESVAFAVSVTNGAPEIAVVSTDGTAVAADLDTLTASATVPVTIVVRATDVFAAPELSVTPAYADGFTVTTDGATATGTLVWTFPEAGAIADVVFTATDSQDPYLIDQHTITVTVVDPPLETVWPSVDEITSNSFLLEWEGQEQPRLDHFKLRVWYGSCDMGSETTDKETFYEWFDNYFDKTGAHFPQGWTVDTTERYNSAIYPLKIVSSGARVITKKYPRPLEEFSFTVHNYAAGGVSTNNFEIYASKGGVEPEDWEQIENTQMGSNGTKTFTFNVADGYRRIKIVRAAPSSNFGIGSFEAKYEGAGTHFVVGSLAEAAELDKETANYLVNHLGSDREYFVQLVTCGTSGEKEKNYAGYGNHEFYTRVKTAESTPRTVILFK